MSADYIAVFPGQGSQKVGMGQSLTHHPIYRQKIEVAEDILDLPLRQLMLNGPQDKLTQTAIAQPALLTLSSILYEIYRDIGHAQPLMAAGHSLGEYTALVCAGVLSFEAAVKLVQRRGALMQEACFQAEGCMSAVMKGDAKAVQVLIQHLELEEAVLIGNFNSPQQFVISGQKDAVQQLGAEIKSQKLGRAIPLRVHGAFHSPLMANAAKAFARELEQVNFQDAQLPVVTNCDGLATTLGEEFREKLKRQMLSPVFWMQSVETMASEGENFLEFGVGKVLGPLILQTVPKAQVQLISCWQDF